MFSINVVLLSTYVIILIIKYYYDYIDDVTKYVIHLKIQFLFIILIPKFIWTNETEGFISPTEFFKNDEYLYYNTLRIA